MNSDQMSSVLRSALAIAGTFLTTYGLLNAGDWATVTGAVLAVAPVVWGIYAHTAANTVAAAAALPDVAHVAVMPTPEGLALKAAVPHTPGAVVIVKPIGVIP